MPELHEHGAMPLSHIAGRGGLAEVPAKGGATRAPIESAIPQWPAMDRWSALRGGDGKIIASGWDQPPMEPAVDHHALLADARG